MAVFETKAHQDLADTLFIRAKRIVPVFTAMAAIVGAGIGVAIAREMGKSEVWSVILWAFVVGIAGFVAGKERAFSLQLKARELLCMEQIDKNTRAEQYKAAGTSA
jgi:hypothetical protein